MGRIRRSSVGAVELVEISKKHFWFSRSYSVEPKSSTRDETTNRQSFPAENWPQSPTGPHGWRAGGLAELSLRYISNVRWAITTWLANATLFIPLFTPAAQVSLSSLGTPPCYIVQALRVISYELYVIIRPTWNIHCIIIIDIRREYYEKLFSSIQISSKFPRQLASYL